MPSTREALRKSWRCGDSSESRSSVLCVPVSLFPVPVSESLAAGTLSFTALGASPRQASVRWMDSKGELGCGQVTRRLSPRVRDVQRGAPNPIPHTHKAGRDQSAIG